MGKRVDDNEAGAESPLLTWPAFIREMLYSEQLRLFLVFAFLSSAYLAVNLDVPRWKAYALEVAAWSLGLLTVWMFGAWGWQAAMRSLRLVMGFPVLRLRYSYETIDPASLIFATGLRQQGRSFRKAGRIWMPGGVSKGHIYIGSFLEDAQKQASGSGRLEVSSIDVATGRIEEQIALLFDFDLHEMTVEVGEDMPPLMRKGLFNRLKEKLSQVHGLQPKPLTPTEEAEDGRPEQQS